MDNKNCPVIKERSIYNTGKVNDQPTDQPNGPTNAQEGSRGS